MIFLLSRIQFGIAIGYHFLFPVTTLGLIFYIVIFESLYFFKNEKDYRTISSFLIRILGVVFAIGVATGILITFSIGSNWGRFSLISGEVLGVQLAVESVLAFTLESWFMIILVFGRKKVSKTVYLISAYCVFIGSFLSAFLIIATNSWMNTPAGFEIINGKIVISNILKAVFNPSTIIRFTHVIIASWITGTIIVAALASYYLLKNRFESISKKMLHKTLLFLIFLPLIQIIAGHSHIINVLENNPVKSPAYEGIFKTTNGAEMYLFGIPDEKSRKIYFGVSIPKFLSFLDSWDFNSKVNGLEEYPEKEWTSVNVVFLTFHLMVFAGMILLALSAVAVFLYLKKKIFNTKWFLKFIIFCLPLPYLAVELGWVSTEIGRQPWMIYKILKTVDSTSLTVNSFKLITTLTILTLVYIVISIIFFEIIKNILHKGPEDKISKG